MEGNVVGKDMGLGFEDAPRKQQQGDGCYDEDGVVYKIFSFFRAARMTDKDAEEKPGAQRNGFRPFIKGK